MIRRLTLLVGLLSSALVLAGLPVLQAQAATQATPASRSTAVAAPPTTLAAGLAAGGTLRPFKASPTIVNVSQLPAVASLTSPEAAALQSPLRVANPAAYAAAKTAPAGGPGTLIGPLSGSHVDWTFNGIDSASQIAATGALVEPPDTQMAVGNTQIVEMVNQSGQVYNKAFPNAKVGSNFSLKTFFNMGSIDPNYVATDPRILYDASVNRWYASMLGFRPDASPADLHFDSTVFLAVSRTSDATGAWAVYQVYYGFHQNANGNSLLCDQPKLGYSGDKLDLSCTDFDNNGAFYGGLGIVTSKTQGLAGGAMTTGVTQPFTDVFGMTAAQNLSPGNFAYMVENRSHAPNPSAAVAIWRWSGDPAAGLGGVSYLVPQVAITATTLPPAAVQQGSATTVDTGDDRLMSAVVQNNELWTTTTEGCTPATDTAVRSCMRLLQFNLTLPTLDSSQTTGIVGKYVYYPTGSVDSVGNLTFVYSMSSVTDYPSVYATQQAEGSPGVFAGGGPIEIGTQAYTGTRWGDYSAAATDSSVPRVIWVAGEWSTTTPVPVVGPKIVSPPSWSTGIGRIDSFVPPFAPTNVTPVAGDTQISLSWTPPVDYGGSPITDYRVTPYLNGVPQTPILTGSPSPSFTVTGLTDWLAYTFSVAAINLYGTGAESAQTQAADPFTPPTWSSLGGVLNSGPAVTSWSAIREDVFVRGADNALWHRSWNGTVWTAWGPLGGVFIGDPAAISPSANHIAVFVRGADNALWYRVTADGGGTWSSWASLGGVLASGPEVASWSATHLDVFVRGADNALWQNTLDGASPWTGWHSLGGVLNGDPMAVSTLANTIDAFVRGADSALWQNSYSGGVWSGWHSLGGVLASSADAASCTGGHIEVMVKGADNRLWHKGYTGTQWTIWEPLGGVFTSDSGSVCRTGTQTVEIMGRGADNALWEGTITGIS